MRYTKQLLTLQQQIDVLKQRGLLIENEEEAKNALDTISNFHTGWLLATDGGRQAAAYIQAWFPILPDIESLPFRRRVAYASFFLPLPPWDSRLKYELSYFLLNPNKL